MPTFIKPKAWEKYKNIVNQFINTDSGKQPFLWLHKLNQPSSFGEDSDTVYLPVVLEGLFQYNYIKTWANNNARDSISGELDVNDVVLYISKDLLDKAGFLNNYGYWDFNWAEDRFVLNGKVYQPGGDTQVAQAHEEALLFFVIFQRVSPTESQEILNTYVTDQLSIYNCNDSSTVNLSKIKVKNLLNTTYTIGEDKIQL